MYVLTAKQQRNATQKYSIQQAFIYLSNILNNINILKKILITMFLRNTYILLQRKNQKNTNHASKFLWVLSHSISTSHFISVTFFQLLPTANRKFPRSRKSSPPPHFLKSNKLFDKSPISHRITDFCRYRNNHLCIFVIELGRSRSDGFINTSST